MSTAVKKRPVQNRQLRPATKRNTRAGGRYAVLDPSRAAPKRRKIREVTRDQLAEKLVNDKPLTKTEKLWVRYYQWLDSLTPQQLECHLRGHKYKLGNEVWPVDGGEMYVAQKLSCACGCSYKVIMFKGTYDVFTEYGRQVPKGYHKPAEFAAIRPGRTPRRDLRVAYFTEVEAPPEAVAEAAKWHRTYKGIDVQ